MSKKEKELNPIFQFQKKYRIYAKYDLGTCDYIRDDTGMINSTFDDYYLVSGGVNKDEVHHSYDDVFVLYIWSLKRGNRILEELKKIKGLVLEYEKTDAEVMISFKAENIDIIHEHIKLRTNGSDISPTDIKNLPKETYGIPEKALEEFTKVYKDSNIPMAKYKQLYIEFIDSKTTAKNNALHKFQVSEIPPKNFIYHMRWWDELLKFISSYKL